MPDIEIEDVQFSPPWLDEPDMERGERRAWTDVAISVRNHSSKITHYVMADLRNLRYDESSATLKLIFAELPPNENIVATSVVLPHFMPVLPGTTAVIRDSIPIQMKGIDFTAGPLPSVQVIDISGMQRVEVTLTHDTTPFRPVHTDRRVEIQRQLHCWGKRVEHASECCLPTERANEETSREST
jgi:predicted thioesterase